MKKGRDHSIEILLHCTTYNSLELMGSQGLQLCQYHRCTTLPIPFHSLVGHHQHHLSSTLVLNWETSGQNWVKIEILLLHSLTHLDNM